MTAVLIQITTYNYAKIKKISIQAFASKAYLIVCAVTLATFTTLK